MNTDDLVALHRIARELRYYNFAADKYKGEHIRGVWAREIDDIAACLRAAPAAPIDMILHCPACGLQHIDCDESPSDREWSAQSAGDREVEYWTNPPHRSHLCHGCGHIWRPSDTHTNGVAAIKTKGKADSAPAAQGAHKLDDIEQYRMQMAVISTAAIGYWKEGDSIHPDYDTVALRDTAKLYLKYDALHKAAQDAVDERAVFEHLTGWPEHAYRRQPSGDYSLLSTSVAWQAWRLRADLSQPEGHPEPIVWRCFHCDETFTDTDAAAEHFGKSEYQQPACQIDVAEYRKMEEAHCRSCEEDTDLHRQMHAMQSDHQTALQREEEKGYARGLKDAPAEQAQGVSDAEADKLFELAHLWAQECYRKGLGKDCDIDGSRSGFKRALLAAISNSPAPASPLKVPEPASIKDFQHALQHIKVAVQSIVDGAKYRPDLMCGYWDDACTHAEIAQKDLEKIAARDAAWLAANSAGSPK